jgi:hypothetical protein
VALAVVAMVLGEHAGRHRDRERGHRGKGDDQAFHALSSLPALSEPGL